ncbi:putative helicase [Vibrio phage CKB-S1]|nr:putative helicase [Vibrio phage CKB-S1]
MFNLRDYQQLVYNRIMQAWQEVRSVLAVVPTGGGKTVIFSKLIHDHNGSAAAIVHRKEIVGQISLSLAAFGVKHRIVAPPKTIKNIRRKHFRKFGESFVDQNAQCGVISVQTLTSKSSANNDALQRWVKQVTLCVYDEGHHYVEQGIWAKAVHMMEHAKLLFVSATPERADGIGLGVGHGGFAETMVEGPTTKWLIDQGYLCKFVYRAPQTDLDLRDVALGKNGDFNAKALKARVVESHLVGDVVQHYRRWGENKRAIVFATDVETAEQMAEAFRAAGYTAAALSGETETNERDHCLEQFEAGAIQILVNVDLFDEGFDVPAVECVILARPTQSLAKYLQMIGRALRIMDGKDYAVIIDPVRNWERHGAPTLPRQWSLEGREKGARSNSDTVPQRVCDACTIPYEAFYKQCPYCGHVNVVEDRSSPDKVDGDLVELDIEAMEALFAAVQEAKMGDQEYEMELIRRGVPQIGRGQALRRHQAARYRRQVLEHLIGWWVGCQEQLGRDRSEIYRRFYLRYGVDVATALTLDIQKTDSLIDKIQANFTKEFNQ